MLILYILDFTMQCYILCFMYPKMLLYGRKGKNKKMPLFPNERYKPRGSQTLFNLLRATKLLSSRVETNSSYLLIFQLNFLPTLYFTKRLDLRCLCLIVSCLAVSDPLQPQGL